MSADPTDLYVASQTAHEIIVIDASHITFGVAFIVTGLIFLLLGF
jgi:hypothetical protein